MAELQAAGHTFRTHCDTEVVVHAWEEWGADSVRRFNGMFAFALWDRNLRTFFMARDRLGKKPLHYTVLPDGRLLFASELKSLLEERALQRRLDGQAVEDYLAYGYVPDPRTILRDVYSCRPRTTMTCVRGKRPGSPVSYWDVSFSPVLSPRPPRWRPRSSSVCAKRRACG